MGVDYDGGVSPTVLRERGFRFYFFSGEEPRMHIHVHHDSGEAKICLEPDVEVAQNSASASADSQRRCA